MINQAHQNNSIRFVLSDLDGTLTNSKGELPDANRKAIRELQQAGIKFAVVSGRPPRGMKKFMKDLDLQVPLTCFGGGLVVDPMSFEIIAQHLLDPQVAEQVIETLSEFGIATWIYRGEDWFVRSGEQAAVPLHVEKEERSTGIKPKIVGSFLELNDGIIKVVGVSDDASLLERAEQEMRERFKDQAWSTRSQSYYLDITHPEANKGASLEWYSRTLGITSSDIFAIGDMPGDVQMFKRAGYSAAMSNASVEVQAEALWVTSSNDEDGFAQAIHRLVLNHDQKEVT